MILLPSDFWEVKNTPKYGRGLFATKNIPAGTVISDYIGLVLDPLKDDVSEKAEGLYLMYYHDRALIYPLDTKAVGAHLINHSCAPNSWIYTYKGHTLFFALRKIFPGEEITISYQLSPQDTCLNCSHICYCKDKRCSASLHLSKEKFDSWNLFHEVHTKLTKRSPIRYGKLLKVLENYPPNIPDDPIYPLFGSRLETPHFLPGRTIPSIKSIRKLIRDTGKTIVVSELNIQITGVDNGVVTEEKI